MFDPKWAAVNGLKSVWSSTFRCGTPNLATRSYDATIIQSTRAIIIDAFVNKFDCSKHDATMVSGSQATVCTCSDYSGSNVLKMGAIRYSIFTDCNYESSFWVHFWTSKATCVSYFDGATKSKRRGWQKFTAVPATFIYGCRHYDHDKSIKNRFSKLNGFLKTKYLNKIGKNLRGGGGGMFDNGNRNWWLLGMAFLCRTMYFCVEPGIFVSNRLFVSNECCNKWLLPTSGAG